MDNVFGMFLLGFMLYVAVIMAGSDIAGAIRDLVRELERRRWDN